jgi:hypothetical protein
MQQADQPARTQPSSRYARAVEASKRIRWDIDKDVIRGRRIDLTRKFLPDGLSKVRQLEFLGESEKRLLSQIQGRSYANIFGLVERFIAAKMLEVSRDYSLGDQDALESLIRFGDEELKHQKLFRRLEGMMAEAMPAGYSFVPEPNSVAGVVLERSTWAVLALTCHIELFTQKHYRESIDGDNELSEVWKDVFLYHWKEESQHAILDELEWIREDAKLTQVERDRAVDDLIALIHAVDSMVRAQATSDALYFRKICGRSLSDDEDMQVRDCLLKAYRWQYIVSGVQEPHFARTLGSLTDSAQGERIDRALAPILRHVGMH